MDTPKEGWNKDYSRRGRRWAGQSWGLPAFPSYERVLEVGCGDGKTLASLVESRPSFPDSRADCPVVVGLDFSLSALHLCSDNTKENKKVHLVCADAARMPFTDSTFDTVLLFHVLGHATFQSRKKICDEVERIIRTGGQAIFRVFSPRDFRSGKGEEVEDMTYLRGDGTFTHYFTRTEITELNPLLSLVSMETFSWNLRVRGNELVREEIYAVFRKEKS